MSARRKYRKRETKPVVAVRLSLETEGFSYQKWGHEQRCKRGDWIVDNDGDIYTVDASTFAETYAETSRGLYEKIAPVWAEQASANGEIKTKEGVTAYEAGDYLVFNTEDGRDGYAVSQRRFEQMYVAADPGEDAPRL